MATQVKKPNKPNQSKPKPKKPRNHSARKPHVEVKVNNTKPKKKSNKSAKPPAKRGKSRKWKRSGLMAVFVSQNPVMGTVSNIGFLIVGFVVMRLLSDGLFWAMSKMDDRTRRIVVMILQPLMLLIGYWATRSGKFAVPARAVWMGAATYTGMSIGGNVVSLLAPQNCADNAACVTAKAIFPDFLTDNFRGQLASHRAAGLIIQGDATGAVDERALMEKTAQAILEAQREAVSSAIITDTGACQRLSNGLLLDTSRGVIIDPALGTMWDAASGLIITDTPSNAGQLSIPSEGLPLQMFADILLQPASSSEGMANDWLASGMDGL